MGESITVVGNESVEEARMIGTEITPQHTIYPEDAWPWLTMIRKEAKNDRLVVVSLTAKFEDIEETAFSLAAWIFKPEEYGGPGIVLELESFDDPRTSWPTGLLSKEMLLIRLRPEQSERRRRLRLARKSKQEAIRQQKIEERSEYARRYRKMGDELGAKLVEQGAPGFRMASDADSEQQIAEAREVLMKLSTNPVSRTVD